MNFMEIIDSIETKASKSISRNPDDYLDENGLLVCGKCNSRKQCVVEFMGKIRKPFCLCNCETEKFELQGKEIIESEKIREINNMRYLGFHDKSMMNFTFEKDDESNPNLSLTAKKYVENFPKMIESGKGLLLFGNVGSGKTFIASCIANSLIDQGYPCMVTNFSRIINTLSGMYEGKQEYIDNLNKFDLLVIDDLAAERDTEYTNEIILNVIDSRYRSKKPLIVTTNLTAEEIHNQKDIRKQRTYSRLHEMCIPIGVYGNDRREKGKLSDNEYYFDLLKIKKPSKSP